MVDSLDRHFGKSHEPFDPQTYKGSSLDTTGDQVMGNGRFNHADQVAEPGKLLEDARKLEAGTHDQLLPDRFADLEFGDERSNIRYMARLARAKGVKIAFLYLPFYSAKQDIVGADFYRGFGPIWNAGFIAGQAGLYHDYAHLTGEGARRVTDWLEPLVAAELGGDAPRTPRAS
jgi:hypothetical protein